MILKMHSNNYYPKDISKICKSFAIWSLLTIIIVISQCVHCYSSGNYHASDFNKKFSINLATDLILKKNKTMHPTIFYIEDFLNNDNVEQHADKESEIRGYNKIHNKTYTCLKPEKIRFDIVSNEKRVFNDSYIDSKNVDVEEISLVGNNKILSGTTMEDLSSHKLHKRWNSASKILKTHNIQKRTPHVIAGTENFNQILTGVSYDNSVKIHTRHPIKGNYFNPISLPGLLRPSIANRFGDENETDRVIWGISFAKPGRSQPSPPPRRAPPPLVYDPNPRRENMLPVTTNPSILHYKEQMIRAEFLSSDRRSTKPDVIGRFHIGNRN